MDADAATETAGATPRAFCDHGYADLALQHTADETDGSPAAIHSDTKAALLTAFLEHRDDEYAARIEAIPGDRPRERLQSSLEFLLAVREEAPTRAFRTATVEGRARAPAGDVDRECVETRLATAAPSEVAH